MIQQIHQIIIQTETFAHNALKFKLAASVKAPPKPRIFWCSRSGSCVNFADCGEDAHSGGLLRVCVDHGVERLLNDVDTTVMGTEENVENMFIEQKRADDAADGFVEGGGRGDLEER